MTLTTTAKLKRTEVQEERKWSFPSGGGGVKEKPAYTIEVRDGKAVIKLLSETRLKSEELLSDDRINGFPIRIDVSGLVTLSSGTINEIILLRSRGNNQPVQLLNVTPSLREELGRLKLEQAKIIQIVEAPAEPPVN